MLQTVLLCGKGIFMAKMVPTAGEMDVQIKDTTCEKSNIVIVGKLDVWDSADTRSMPIFVGVQRYDMDFKMYFSPQDFRGLIPLVFRPSVILFLFLIPFRLLGMLTRGKSHT